jgi:hypothetical protein
MSRTTNIPHPPPDFAGQVKYAIFPREKRAFNTVLDAHKLLGNASKPVSDVRYASEGDDVVVAMDYPFANGHLREEVRLVRHRDGLVMRALSRDVFDAAGRMVRSEQAPDFRHDALGLPVAAYPEVALPFLLGWIPHDGERRSVYAWINDRFIAKVYIEVAARGPLAVQRTAYDTVEVIMYPDLNDWIPLGAVITRLVKPFVPKYRMWYERRAPHRLVRFEGPYGPPGAPELVLELIP